LKIILIELEAIALQFMEQNFPLGKGYVSSCRLKTFGILLVSIEKRIPCSFQDQIEETKDAMFDLGHTSRTFWIDFVIV
jgi:hypothetical protein